MAAAALAATGDADAVVRFPEAGSADAVVLSPGAGSVAALASVETRSEAVAVLVEWSLRPTLVRPSLSRRR